VRKRNTYTIHVWTVLYISGWSRSTYKKWIFYLGEKSICAWVSHVPLWVEIHFIVVLSQHNINGMLYKTGSLHNRKVGFMGLKKALFFRYWQENSGQSWRGVWCFKETASGWRFSCFIFETIWSQWKPTIWRWWCISCLGRNELQATKDCRKTGWIKAWHSWWRLRSIQGWSKFWHPRQINFCSHPNPFQSLPILVCILHFFRAAQN